MFLANNDSLTPTLPVPHSHKTPTDPVAPMIVINNTIYGIAGTGVSPWNTTLGGYFLLRSLAYDANGGSGTVPSTIIQQIYTTATVAQGDSLSRSGYQFTSWNTAADGSGATYAAGSSLTLISPSMTLYAQWTIASYPPIPQTGDSTTAGLYIYLVLGLLSLAGSVIIMLTKKKQHGR